MHLHHWEDREFPAHGASGVSGAPDGHGVMTRRLPADVADRGPGPVHAGRGARRCRVRDQAGAGHEDDHLGVGRRSPRSGSSAARSGNPDCSCAATTAPARAGTAGPRLLGVMPAGAHPASDSFIALTINEFRRVFDAAERRPGYITEHRLSRPVATPTSSPEPAPSRTADGRKRHDHELPLRPWHPDDAGAVQPRPDICSTRRTKIVLSSSPCP